MSISFMPSTDYVQQTELPGVYTISRPSFPDERGFFREVYRKSDLDAILGFSFEPVQANHSRSQKGTLRGIHVAPWHKLVTVAHGEVQQIVVDCRKDSPTFGKHVSVMLGGDNHSAVFVPAGCGNGFLVTSDEADYIYQVTDYWAPGRELGIIYNDPDLAIQWALPAVTLSDKDLQNSRFATSKS